MNIDQHITFAISETPKANIYGYGNEMFELSIRSGSDLGVNFWGTEEQIKRLAKSISEALERYNAIKG